MKAGNERRVCGYDRVAGPPRAGTSNAGLKIHLICHQTKSVQRHLISWSPLLIDGTAPTPGRGGLGVRYDRPRGRAGAWCWARARRSASEAGKPPSGSAATRTARISAASRPEGKRRFTEVVSTSPGSWPVRERRIFHPPWLVPGHKGWCRARGLRLARKQRGEQRREQKEG